MLQVAVILLIRLGMDDDRVVNRGAIHALQLMLGRRNLGRSIGRQGMIRKSRIIPGKAMKVRIDYHRRRRRLPDSILEGIKCR